MKPVSPASAGRFFTTGPPGELKSLLLPRAEFAWIRVTELTIPELQSPLSWPSFVLGWPWPGLAPQGSLPITTSSSSSHSAVRTLPWQQLLQRASLCTLEAPQLLAGPCSGAPCTGGCWKMQQGHGAAPQAGCGSPGLVMSRSTLEALSTLRFQPPYTFELRVEKLTFGGLIHGFLNSW